MRSARPEDSDDEQEQPVRVRVHPPPTEEELLRRVARRYDEIIEEPLTFADLHGIPRRR